MDATGRRPAPAPNGTRERANHDGRYGRERAGVPRGEKNKPGGGAGFDLSSLRHVS